MTTEITTVLSGRNYLECPRWHDGRIWVSDFYAHEVISALENGSDVRVEAQVPGQPSGLGWLPDGRLLIVSMTDRRILRREPDGTLVTHADLSGRVDSVLNDMTVDAQGRAYVGAFGFDLMSGADIASTSLFRVDPDGSVTTVADDLWFPNGMAITSDSRTLLVDETFGNRVSAFDIADDGSLSGRRDWAKFGDVPTESALTAALAQGVVGPDGCAIDADDHLWIADALNGRVIQVREGGQVLQEIVPGTGVFACGFGGRDGHTLYLCQAPDFSAEARSQATESSLGAARVDASAPTITSG